MKLLLDTHAILWFWFDNPKLSANAKSLIEDLSNDVLVSWASPWEVAIKVSRKKLDIGGPFAGFFPTNMAASEFDWLPTNYEHLTIVSELPFHHDDPFDRLMIAQAIVEKIPIVSTDTKFDAYPIHRLW